LRRFALSRLLSFSLLRDGRPRSGCA
jgi:hypothetical protein